MLNQVLNVKHLIVNENNIKKEFYIVLAAQHYITFSETIKLLCFAIKGMKYDFH